MIRRPTEPEEAIEPALDGLDDLNSLVLSGSGGLGNDVPVDLADLEADETLSAPVDDVPGEPVVLIFGKGEDAEALIRLAAPCGFIVRQIVGPGEEPVENPLAEAIFLENLDNIVADCNIERNAFVCIFLEDETACELVLSQCLASDANYIGLAGDSEKVARVFAELKACGAPDAELAAIAAPMGLNVGADAPDQRAVAIVAEMLAAKSGKLKRFLYGSRKH